MREPKVAWPLALLIGHAFLLGISKGSFHV